MKFSENINGANLTSTDPLKNLRDVKINVAEGDHLLLLNSDGSRKNGLPSFAPLVWDGKKYILRSFDFLKSISSSEYAMIHYTTCCKSHLLIGTVDGKNVRIHSIANDESWFSPAFTRAQYKNGPYILRVTDVFQDKDGHPYLMVDPVKEIDQIVLDSAEMRALFYVSGLFVESGVPDREFNYSLLIENASKIDASINKYYASKEKEVAKIVHLFIEGTLPSERIISWMATATEDLEDWFDHRCSELIEHPDKYEGEYPLLMKRIRDEDIKADKAAIFVRNLHKLAIMAVVRKQIRPVRENIFGQIEVYLNLLKDADDMV